jgi:hypothetical protein
VIGVAGVDRQRCRSELLVDRLNLEPDALERGGDEVTDVAPLVLGSGHDLEHDRRVVKEPLAVLKDRPGELHLLRNDLLREFRLVADVAAMHHREDRQLVVRGRLTCDGIGTARP